MNPKRFFYKGKAGGVRENGSRGVGKRRKIIHRIS
jgi:hypothetical protein